MALCSQIVDLIGLDLAHQTDQAGGIGQVAVVQGDCVLLDQVVDTSGVGDGSAADDAVDLVALLQKELCQVGTILTGNTGNQRNFRHILTSTFLLSLQSSAWFSCNTVYYFSEYSLKTEFTILPFVANRLHNIALF